MSEPAGGGRFKATMEYSGDRFGDQWTVKVEDTLTGRCEEGYLWETPARKEEVAERLARELLRSQEAQLSPDNQSTWHFDVSGEIEGSTAETPEG